MEDIVEGGVWGERERWTEMRDRQTDRQTEHEAERVFYRSFVLGERPLKTIYFKDPMLLINEIYFLGIILFSLVSCFEVFILTKFYVVTNSLSLGHVVRSVTQNQCTCIDEGHKAPMPFKKPKLTCNFPNTLM